MFHFDFSYILKLQHFVSLVELIPFPVAFLVVVLPFYLFILFVDYHMTIGLGSMATDLGCCMIIDLGCKIIVLGYNLMTGYTVTIDHSSN